MNHPPLRIGVAGLGRAFTMMLPTFLADPRVQLVGAADPLAAARSRFESDFGVPSYDSVQALCEAPAVQVLYVATPHQWHRQHVCAAAAAGKHVLVEKPMAISIDECSAMVDAARAAKVQLIVGHSHSFDRPIQRLREIVESGVHGAVRMITAQYFTDFLYRPRRPEELDTSQGGGVVHSQAAHQMDIVRLLGGGLVRSLRAFTGAWDAVRPTEGAYSALLGFEGGAFCSATYSGYGHYNSDALMDNISEAGLPKNPDDYGSARRRLRGATPGLDAAVEASMKAARNYGGANYLAPDASPANMVHQHFGHIVVSCDKADLRPTPTGIAIYGDERQQFEALASPAIARVEVIDELFAAVVQGRAPLHSGEWARATTETCLAILESASINREIVLQHQVRPGPL
jgi:phthalate 4,5-cis-dihydrodiol dehydrogenase